MKQPTTQDITNIMKTKVDTKDKSIHMTKQKRKKKTKGKKKTTRVGNINKTTKDRTTYNNAKKG